MKQLESFFLLILTIFTLLFLWSTRADSADITSAATGNWSSTGSWTGGVVPDLTTDNVTIQNGHTITLDGNYVVGNFTIAGGGALNASSNTLNVNGTWDTSNGGFNRGTGTVVFTGNCGSTCNLNVGNTNVTQFNTTRIASGANVTFVSTGVGAALFDDCTVEGTLNVGPGSVVRLLPQRYLIMTAAGSVSGAGEFIYVRGSGSTTLLGTLGTIDVATFTYQVLNCGCSDTPPGIPLSARTYGGTVKVNASGNNIIDYIYISGGDLVVNGDLWIAQGGWGDGNPGSSIRLWNLQENRNITIGGDLIIGENVDCAYFYPGSGTINVAGDVNIQNTSCGLATYDNTLEAGTSTINVGGNWVNSDTFTAGTSTVAFNGTGAQAITSGGDSFYDLTVLNTSDIVSLSDNASLLAGGTLAINAGATLDLNGNNLTVPTTFNNNGTLQLEGGETVPAPVNGTGSLVKYDGAAGPYTLKSWTYDSLQLSSAGATTYNMPGPLSLPGSLTIDVNNTLDTQNNNLDIGGNWTNNGTFTAGTGAVTLDGTGTQDITSGGSAFNMLEITNSTSDVTFLDGFTALNFTSNTPSASMLFNAGSTYTVTNLTLNGADGSRISLRSTSPGTQWNLNVSGAQSLSYVDVSDSDASGGDTVICTDQCIGLNENNDNWTGLLVAVPTMTEWGMIIFMVLAGLWALYYLSVRRRV